MRDVIDAENGVTKYDDFRDLREWQLYHSRNDDELHTLLSAWYYWRNYQILPVAGGYLNQPYEMMQDFRKLDRIYQYHTREKQINK